MSEASELPEAQAPQEPSPLAIGSVVWRVGSRVRATVILKAAFGYTPSGDFLLLETPELQRVDQCSEDGTQLLAACDYAPFIRSPEVLVVGRAHGAGEKIAVSLRVEREGQKLIDKQLDLQRGALATPLGPLMRNWPFPPSELGQGLVTLEASLDSQCFQRAAEDQATVQLRGNERIRLVGLDPTQPVLKLAPRLPAVHAQVIIGGKAAVVPLVADAYIIETETRRFYVLWRGSVPIEQPERLGEAVIETYVDTAMPPEVEVEEPIPDTVALAVSNVTSPLPPMEVKKGGTLPFARSDASNAEPLEAGPIAGAPWSPVQALRTKTASGVQQTVSLEELQALSELDLDQLKELSRARAQSASGVMPVVREEPKDEKVVEPAVEPAAAVVTEPELALEPKVALKVPAPQAAQWRKDAPADVEAVSPPKPVFAERKDLNSKLYGGIKKKR
jgi:hypothetical protein